MRSLVAQLPRESAYVRAVAGEPARWGDVEHLLAGIHDVLAVVNRNIAQGSSRTPLPVPKKLPRPGVADAGEGRRFGGRAVPAGRMRQMLDRLNGRRSRG